VVTVSTSRDVWGSERLRGVEEILLPKVDPLTGNEIVKGANTIFPERGRFVPTPSVLILYNSKK
jgi:hypothetical protein